MNYADAFVIGAPVAPTATFVTEPVVVFEILSKSTGNDNLGVKRAEYEATPSVQRYIALQQTHRAAQEFYCGNGRQPRRYFGAYETVWRTGAASSL